MWGALGQDFVYGLRRLGRNPGFSAVAILTLAIGIGSSTAIFSLVNRVLILPLPFQEPQQLVRIWHHLHSRGMSRLNSNESQFLYYREKVDALSGMAAYYTDGRNLASAGEAVRVDVTFVSAGFFNLLGVGPEKGRRFRADEEQPGRHQVAILDNRFWRQHFEGKDVLGRTLFLDGVPHTIVGIMPEEFDYPPNGRALWTPFPINPDDLEAGAYLSVIGRLRADTDIGQASQELMEAAIQHQLDLAVANSREELVEAGWGSFLQPLQRDLSDNMRTPLLVLLAAVVFLLLITCANVAGLLLARTQARARELALRSALGASRVRLLRMLLSENLVLFLSAALVGMLSALWSSQALAALAPVSLPSTDTPHLDWRVFTFALTASLLTGLLFGLLPAVIASRRGISRALKSGGRGQVGWFHQHFWNGLVVSQVALATILLIGAGLTLRNLAVLMSYDPGYVQSDVLTVRVSLPVGAYGHPQALTLYRRLLEQLRSLPGIEAVGGVSDLPLSDGNAWGQGRIFAERASPATTAEPVGKSHFLLAERYAVLPGYFEAMQIGLLEGRLPGDSDIVHAAPAAVVDDVMARRFWPGESALGKRIALRAGDDPLWMTVVGVVRHVRNSLGAQGRPQAWFSYSQTTFHSVYLTVRTSMPPAGMISTIRNVVKRLDPQLPVFDVHTMQERRSQSAFRQRFTSLLLTIFATASLLLATLAIYAVVSFAIGQRRGEFGVRMALGAEPGAIRRMILSRGAILTGIGIGLGGPLAALLARFLAGILVEVSPFDPLSFALAAALPLCAGITACLIPARRASRIDPLEALRSE